MKYTLVIFILIPFLGISQSNYKIETTDITNFWKAYDNLNTAKTKSDSISVIQEQYIDNATDYFKEFIKARKFTASEYVSLIRAYPKFWNSVRPLTENIASKTTEIDSIFKQYQKVIPNFNQPNVCFAIGCLRSGGTTSKNLILIGSEIAASNHQVDKSEMTGWLASVIGNSGDIVSMIAHETIHTQQRYNVIRFNTVNAVLMEGVADFFTTELIGLNINQKVFEYGYANQCSLYKEFKSDLENYPRKYDRWLYQGDSEKDRPADLGYFIGCQIAKMYYNKSENKTQAITDLLNIRKYRQIFKESGFMEESCP